MQKKAKEIRCLLIMAVLSDLVAEAGREVFIRTHTMWALVLAARRFGRTNKRR